MVGELLRDLEARFPWLARWSGGRLDIELPALTASVVVHGLVLAGLAVAGYQVHRESQREFRSEMVDTRLLGDSTFQDLDQSAERPAELPAAGSFAPTLAATITSAPSSAGGVPVSANEESSRSLAPPSRCVSASKGSMRARSSPFCSNALARARRVRSRKRCG